jgi:hypothetical protein
MFGDPVTSEPEAFGMDGEVGSVGQSISNIAALNNRDKVEYGIECHSS